MLTKPQHLALAAVVLQTPLATAAATEKVWSVFAYTLYGDSTPAALIGKQPAGLSEYGASQLVDVGSAFRSRYVSSAGSANATESAIRSISPSSLSSSDVQILSTTDQNVISSAQAFMLGLYPPLGQDGTNTTNVTANGTVYSAPLDGYQFPQIVTVGGSDPASLFVAGQENCNMYEVAVSEYQNGEDALELTQMTETFYEVLLHQALGGFYDESSATYANAVSIADFLDYQAIHNSTAMYRLFGDQLIQARYLADHFMYSTNGQDTSGISQSAAGITGPIAGQTLASSILKAFNLSMEEQWTGPKMTLMFGGDEPAVALASLLGLASDQQPNFYSRPVRGGSLVFELYSLGTNDDDSYPPSSEMFVRFFLHNGTDSSTEFVPYSLFGTGPSNTYLPWNTFAEEVGTFAVQSVQEWCVLCNADSVFCSGVLDRNDSTSSPKKYAVSPAVAGVIGAVVTLAVIGLLALGLFLYGLRNRRENHKPSTGGFKGNNKLASDTDVSFRNPIWGTGKTAQMEEANDASGGVIVRGQERLGSWEMGQQRSEEEDTPSSRPEIHTEYSGLEDESEWRLHSRLEPVKIRESV